MQIIYKYMADDGKEFDSEEECKSYEDSCAWVECFDYYGNSNPVSTYTEWICISGYNAWHKLCTKFGITDEDHPPRQLEYVYEDCMRCRPGIACYSLDEHEDYFKVIAEDDALLRIASVLRTHMK